MKILLSLVVLAILTSCNEKHNTAYEATNEIAMISSDPEHPGKALMEKNCYACHNPTTAHEDRIAPPMFAIKKHYLRNDISKEQFTKNILDWTAQPSAEKAKMPGAVDKFGVMPYQKFDPSEIELIAAYLFEYELTQPSCCQNNLNARSQTMGDGPGKGHGMRKGMKQGKGMHGQGHSCKGDGNCCGNGKKI